MKIVHYILVVLKYDGDDGKLPHEMSNSSSINLSEHNVHCTNDGNNVSQHVVLADVVHEGEVEEARGLDLAPVRLDFTLSSIHLNYILLVQ